MPARIRLPIGSVTFVHALLVSSLGVCAPADTQNSASCVPAPNSSAPQNSHWYYRTDRTTQRKCWYLRATDQSSSGSAAQGERDGATPNPLQSRHANLSDKEVARLYTEFLQWRDRQVPTHW